MGEQISLPGSENEQSRPQHALVGWVACSRPREHAEARVLRPFKTPCPRRQTSEGMPPARVVMPARAGVRDSSRLELLFSYQQ
jgi:hypothetical protein